MPYRIIWIICHNEAVENLLTVFYPFIWFFLTMQIFAPKYKFYKKEKEEKVALSSYFVCEGRGVITALEVQELRSDPGLALSEEENLVFVIPIKNSSK